MRHRPVILITPSTEHKGAEFADASISLSNRYTDAVIAAGGLPQVFPATTSRAVIAEAVERCDGVLMTGGDDIDPKLYAKDLPEALAKTVGPLEPDRDTWERVMIAEILQRQKPLFGICRGHQMLNVALGGTLVVDIPTQVPKALNHRQMDKKMEPVHEVSISADSMLRQITGQQTLGVNSTHHQAIGQLAEPLRAVATSSDGIIEAVELKDAGGSPFLLAVQFHPERLIDKNKVFLQLFSSFIDACARSRQKNI
ncbi:MAG TPA: gamma-glutamyl-gamma-aminobutyrate hydrolase family protein [Candidatus Saccharimonadales bacterium]|jgi:putative glutamine amidotransferase|nr:gamma-glutamyl-gamma-aminobutyrate hydrolase family protein [Candidatus Saccharimonadales bacterium]